MKESSAIKTSISITPLWALGMASFFQFGLTCFISCFDATLKICWEAGIMAVICYGFVAIHNCMENAHFEIMNMNKDEN